MSEQKNWFDDDNSNQDNNQDNNTNRDNNNGWNNNTGWNNNSTQGNNEHSDDYVKSGSYQSGPQYNQYNNPYYGPVDPPGTNRKFGGAAFGCGIASIALLITGVLSVVLGALGILFSNLSRRRGKGYPSKAKAGLVMSIIGIILGGIITFNSFLYVYTMISNDQFYDQFYQEMNESYKMIYGEELDQEEFDQMFGIFGGSN